MAYDRLDPFGASRDNWHMAVQAQMFAAVHTRRGVKPPSVHDFLYQAPEEKREKNAQSFLSFLRAKAKK